MIKSNKISENTIKEMLLNHLFSRNNGFAITEFSIANFKRRVDLVFSKEELFYAFEIKSEFDTLNRLDGQLIEYINHFDKVTVVSATKHIKNVLLKTPPNVAVWEIQNSRLKVIRAGKTVRIKDKYIFIRMMTLTELLSFARKMKLQISGKKRIDVENLILKLPVNTIRKEALICIKERYRKRSLNYYDPLVIPIPKEQKNKQKNNTILSKRCKNRIDILLEALNDFKP